jgi:membrane protein
MAEADKRAEQDWRAEAERTKDSPLGLARARAAEPGRGREAETPGEIPARGWRDILWRVVWAIPEDRVLSTAGSVSMDRSGQVSALSSGCGCPPSSCRSAPN